MVRNRCTEKIMARFFVDAADVQGNTIYIRSKEDIKHISKVLRMKEGDKLEISDSSQWEYDAEIEFIRGCEQFTGFREPCLQYLLLVKVHLLRHFAMIATLSLCLHNRFTD